MQQPSVGRVVIYRTKRGVDSPAIITAVHGSAHEPPLQIPPAEGHVHLEIFWPRGTPPDYINDGGVPEDTDGVMPGGEHKGGHWRWPERV